MEDNKKKTEDELSGKAAVERGNETIDAQKKLAEKEKGAEKAADEEKKDAEKWRSEG